jgi:hypothetical protein
VRFPKRAAAFSPLVSQSKLLRHGYLAGQKNERSAMKLFRLSLWAAALPLLATTAQATLVYEQFATDPALAGWQAFGDTNLFQWDATNQDLKVTWDSTQRNSYYYHPLDRAYTKADGFCVQFDLTFADSVAVGYFELALGLCNFAEATSTNFSRANAESPNLCEFDYFPTGMASYGPSMDATLAAANDIFYFGYDSTPPMNNDVTYHVVLIHSAGADTISGTVYTNDVAMTTLPEVYSEPGFTDFQLDTLTVFNYTTQDDIYGDSLLAHGTVANLAFASPLPVGLVVPAAAGKVQFTSDTNWAYTLEQSTDFQSWTAAAVATPGNGTNLWLQATNPPAAAAYYRVRADLP